MSSNSSDSNRYQSCRERIRSFWCWPGTQRPQSLATAGFFYVQGNVDTVECFHCGVQIFDWKPFDDPLTEHLRLSKQCTFAKLLHCMRNVKRHLEDSGPCEEIATHRNQQSEMHFPTNAVDGARSDDGRYLLIDLMLSILEHILL